MGRANDRTLALANRSVAGSEGDPNRGSFQPAFADESIDRMCNRSSDRGREGNRVVSFASRLAPTMILWKAQIPCGSEPAREDVSENASGGNSMVDFHTGGCHCGQLRYQFSGPLHDIAHCHCSICRRVSGGIVTTWITVPASSLSMAGRDAGAVRLFTHLRALFLRQLWGATGIGDPPEPGQHRRDHRHPRPPGTGPGRTAHLDRQPLAVAAPGRAFAGRSRRNALIRK